MHQPPFSTFNIVIHPICYPWHETKFDKTPVFSKLHQNPTAFQWIWLLSWFVPVAPFLISRSKLSWLWSPNFERRSQVWGKRGWEVNWVWNHWVKVAVFGAKTFCIEVTVVCAGYWVASTKQRAPVSENIYPLFSHFALAHWFCLHLCLFVRVNKQTKNGTKDIVKLLGTF